MWDHLIGASVIVRSNMSGVWHGRLEAADHGMVRLADGSGRGWGDGRDV